MPDWRTNHFRVTCPFCTLFMLKPTVGIELKTQEYISMVWFWRLGGSYVKLTHSIVNSPPCITD